MHGANLEDFLGYILWQIQIYSRIIAVMWLKPDSTYRIKQPYKSDFTGGFTMLISALQSFGYCLLYGFIIFSDTICEMARSRSPAAESKNVELDFFNAIHGSTFFH